SIPVTASYPWTSAGSRTFRVVVDADDVIVETNETNNSSSRTDEPVAGLDLVVSDTDISFLNGPVYGQTLNASVTLGNSGTVSSPTFGVDVFIEGEGVSISLESIQMSLAAGESRQLNRFQRDRSEEHTSELQSRENLVCRLLLEKKKTKMNREKTTM